MSDIAASIMRKVLITLARSTVSGLGGWADAQSAPSSAEVTRRQLLIVPLDGQKTVDRVEVREINITPNYKSGPHIYPCPVIGSIVSGEVVFQVKGQPEQLLKPGDAFYEPANAVILKFDTKGQSAKFVANFLLGKGELNDIKMVQ
jgi:hypothetical protein